MTHQIGILAALNPMRFLATGGHRSSSGHLAPRYGHQGYRDHGLAPYREAPRDENPSPGTWLMIFGATAVVGGGLAAYFLRGKSTPPPFVGPANTGGGGGGGSTGTGKKGSFVGDPKGYPSWPHQDVFKDQEDFLLALAALGYNVGSLDAPICAPNQLCSTGCNSVICNAAFQSIKKFQGDWKLFRSVAPDPANLPASTSVDGLLGPTTINALYFVSNWMTSAEGDWPSIMADIRADAGIS